MGSARGRERRLAINFTVERIKKGVIDRINDGTYYRFWYSYMDPNDVGCMSPPWRRSDLGYNCSSLPNDVLGEMGDEGYPVAPVGGTGYWNSALVVWEKPNLAKNYPPGYFCVTPYTSDAEQGHVQMVGTGAAGAGQGWGDQYMLQSDTTKGVDPSGMYGWPGPNFDYTMAWTWEYIDYPTWIGLIPGVPVINGFPGYNAHAYGIVRWYRDVCEWWNNMPIIIPLLCVATELTPVIDPARDYSIWQTPGYADPVDHQSYGQHQQQAPWYPCPWNFETSAWSFLAAVDRELGADPYPPADDVDAIAELIQSVQQSFDSTGSNYKSRYDWTMSVIEAALGEPPDGTDPGTQPPYEDIPVDEAYFDLAGIYVPAPKQIDVPKVWGKVRKDEYGEWIEVKYAK